MRRAIFPLLIALLVCAPVFVRAAQTNSLSWNAAADRVSADVHKEPLFPLLEDIAQQTGWHIFVEPEAARTVDVKFSNLPSGEALNKLLGDLNFAFVPQTNEASHLYVFTTRMQNATRRVIVTNSVRTAPPKHTANELLVKLKPGTDIDALAKSLGAKVVGRDDKLGIYRLQFEDAAATEAALASLKTNSDVAAVDYNYLYDPPVIPRQLAGSTVGPVALTLNPSKDGDPCHPVVGLIDTAMQSLGSQLDQFVLKPISVAGDAALNPTGPTHGTAMAETILRAISQTSGGSSAVKILPVDVYGGNETATSWNVALGVQAAINHGATVLNMSLGGASDSKILDDLIQQAIAKGIVIYAAAGNQPVDTQTFPAAIPGVNSVTALAAPGKLASYANYGSFSSLALPGSSVVYLGNQAFMVQGTSPATAYATGVAVGTKGIDCLPWSQIQSAMQQKFPVPSR
jgi:hypothetical protein